MDSCHLIQTLYDTHCYKEKDKKYNTDYRLVPLIEEVRTLNCLKTIELGMKLCKETKTQQTLKKDS